MNSKPGILSPFLQRHSVPALLLLAFIAAPLRAGEPSYLPAGHPDAIALLAPPPLHGSPEQAADLASTVAIHSRCTPTEAALAKSEKKFSVFVFAPAIGTFFQPGKLPKTEAFFQRVEKETGEVTDTAKDYWKRPRPYTVDPTLSSGDPEKSFAYPSGHSTHATVLALLLADLLPDKKDGVLSLSRDIGWRRVLTAKHYPTDIYAGRVLAQAIVRELKANPAFQRDFAEVRAEIAAAKRGN